jgi:hypothetical protein
MRFVEEARKSRSLVSWEPTAAKLERALTYVRWMLCGRMQKPFYNSVIIFVCLFVFGCTLCLIMSLITTGFTFIKTNAEEVNSPKFDSPIIMEKFPLL